jgi:hypothetical protein
MSGVAICVEEFEKNTGPAFTNNLDVLVQLSETIGRINK